MKYKLILATITLIVVLANITVLEVTAQGEPEEWCYEWDFTVTDGGFAPALVEGSFAAEYLPDLGWDDVTFSGGFTQRVLAGIHVEQLATYTSVTATFNRVSGVVADGEAWWRIAWAGLVLAEDTTFPATGNGLTASWTGEQTMSQFDVIVQAHASANFAASGSARITRLRVTGVGSNPFGEDNCSPPPAEPTYDWCYLYDFLSGSYGAAVSVGQWIPGLGFATDAANGQLGLTINHGATVAPARVQFVIARGAFTNEGSINGILTADIFGIETPDQSHFVVSTEQELLTGTLFSDAADDFDTGIKFRMVTSDNMLLRAIGVWGYGVNPFPENHCGPATPAATITPTPFCATATPAPTVTPDPTCNLWTQEFDFAIDDYGFVPSDGGSGVVQGTYVPGVGFQTTFSTISGQDDHRLFIRRIGDIPDVTVVYVHFLQPASSNPNRGIALVWQAGVLSSLSNMGSGILTWFSAPGPPHDFTEIGVGWASGQTAMPGTITKIVIGGEGVNPFTGEPTCTPTPTETPQCIVQTLTPTHSPTPITLTPTPSHTPTFTPTPTPFTLTPTATTPPTQTPWIIFIPTVPPSATPNPTVPRPATATEAATAIPPTSTGTPGTAVATGTGTYAAPGGRGGPLLPGYPNMNAGEDLTDLGEALGGMVNNLGQRIGGYVTSAGAVITRIGNAWTSAAPVAVPGVWNCVQSPLLSQICAIWYFLDNTIFASSVGSLLIPLGVIAIDLFLLFLFIRFARAIAARVGEVFKT